jgi:hypothetical protein
MELQSDNSGQVMLATAFMMAIVLTFIALMLNNVIYYNNISYTGLMNQGHDDVSIKNIVTQEAINAYSKSGGDETKFNLQMQDFACSLNNVSLPEGCYIVISTPTTFVPWNPSLTLPYLSTEFEITKYSTGSSETYKIRTFNSTPYSAPVPTPAPTPLRCKVTIFSPSNNSVVFQGGNNCTPFTIMVIDLSNNQAAVNQVVKLNYNSNIGVFYYDNSRTEIVDQGSTPLMTNDLGMVDLYWYPLYAAGAEGTDTITAQVGLHPSLADQNLSNNVYLTNKEFHPCDHTVTIGAPTQLPGNGGFKDKINGVWYYYVLIDIPITIPAGDFSSFSVGNIYNTIDSSNIDLSYGSLGNYTETGDVHGPYTGHATVKLYLNDRTQPFTANLTTIMGGYCNVHYLPYSTTSTGLVSGSWS